MSDKEPSETPRKRLRDMSVVEIANRQIHLATPASSLPKRGPIKRQRMSEWAKTNEKNLETLARARVRTQLGGPGLRLCEAIAKKTGQRCTHPAIRGEKVCYHHARGQVRRRLEERRLREGRPIAPAAKIAARNVRNLLSHNKLDRDLLLQPVFQSLMRVVAPNWFGAPPTALGVKLTRQDIGDAALLAREMVLAWEAAKTQGDMLPWTSCISRARQLGYDGTKTPFT